MPRFVRPILLCILPTIPRPGGSPTALAYAGRLPLGLPTCLAVIVALMPAAPARALTAKDAIDAALARQWEANPPGQVLFSEGFEAGALEKWKPDPSWSVVDRPDGPGKCAQVVATDDQIQDLVLKKHIPIVPGHPIAVCWRTRFAAGGDAPYLRVDFFGEDGKQGDPYARQDTSRSGPGWTENAVLVSEWFPAYARSITIWFHQSQKSNTTSLLDDVRVVDLWPAVQASLQAQIPALQAQAGQLGVDVTKLRPSPLNNAWKGVVAQRLPWIRTQLDAAAKLEAGSDGAEKALAEPATYLKRLSEAVVALDKGRLATTGLMVYSTRPITSTMVLPHGAALTGEPAAGVNLSACPGEFEPASLVLWSPDGLKGLSIAATDLKGPGGAIPAANVDIKWVKCWYQGGNAPYGIGVVRDRKALIPELLVNDDSLVQVDLAGQHNALKLSFPAGPRHVAIDDPKPVPWGTKLSPEEFPVKDSPTLLPTDLPAGQNKQVWVTVKVPEGAQAGRYQGRLTLAVGGKAAGEVALAVEVLPFSLAEPKTHYDPTQGFTYSLYYWGWLDPEGKAWISFNQKSEQQLRAEFRYMRDRGIVAPCMIWPAPILYEEQAFRKHLQIVRDAGFSDQPLYVGSSDVIGAPTDPAELEKLKQRVSRALAIAREYRFPEIYFYGIDEATGDTLKSERVAWQAVHEAGGKVIVSGFEGQLEAVGDVLDLFNRAGDPMAEQPAEWHKRGHKLWNYANPQTPVEDPLVYRRNFGLYLWKADFDGVNTYCFMDSEGLTWNDFDGPAYRDHAVAYPTVDGVVGTLAMEGFREGSDDVRYVSTLRQEIDRVLRDGTPVKQAAARQAQEWLEGINPRTCDLDAVRAEVVRRILALRK